MTMPCFQNLLFVDNLYKKKYRQTVGDRRSRIVTHTSPLREALVVLANGFGLQAVTLAKPDASLLWEGRFSLCQMDPEDFSRSLFSVTLVQTQPVVEIYYGRKAPVANELIFAKQLHKQLFGKPHGLYDEKACTAKDLTAILRRLSLEPRRSDPKLPIRPRPTCAF